MASTVQFSEVGSKSCVQCGKASWPSEHALKCQPCYADECRKQMCTACHFNTTCGRCGADLPYHPSRHDDMMLCDACETKLKVRCVMK